jgi:hypothetical protein
MDVYSIAKVLIFSIFGEKYLKLTEQEALNELKNLKYP